MTTLRVLLTRACVETGGDCHWATISRDGRLEESGRGTPENWPRASSIEGLLSPDAVRVSALRLPPLPPGRRTDAARMELEDRSIDGLVGAELAVSDQRSDGTLRVAVCDAMTLTQVRSRFAGTGRRWTTLAPLSERVLPRPGTWTWIAPAAHCGFVVTDDGAAVEIEDSALRVPPSLVLALGEADRNGRRPSRVVVLGPAAARLECLRWADSLGVDVEDGGEWSWWAADPPSEPAIQFSPAPAAARPSQPADPVFRTALSGVAAAAILFGLAVVADWAYGSWRLNELARQQRAVAQSAAPEWVASLTPPSAVSRRLRQLRHRAGLAADDDLLPLLARAAVPLAALPTGALRGVSFVEGQTVVDLAPAASDALARLQRDLAAVGVSTVAAPTASGSRLRMTLE